MCNDGCDIWRFEGRGSWGFCQATDANGEYHGCGTYDLTMLVPAMSGKQDLFAA
jgi:hypothetical protein